LWDRNFDRANFLKERFNLPEDFEAVRRPNKPSLFQIASVYFMCFVVMLEVMDEEILVVELCVEKFK